MTQKNAKRLTYFEKTLERLIRCRFRGIEKYREK